jgi:[phosphatase 2A protein]-leucine-carboxy methyltransferase
MSAPGIPNLLSLRGGSRLRGSRGRDRGRGAGSSDTQHRNDVDIQSTDTDAAVSRLSAVSMGYLDDPFASLFVNGPGTRRLPIINRGKYLIPTVLYFSDFSNISRVGTYTRTTALDILINAFISQDAGEAEACSPNRQIISLGAGTDTRYFRLRANNKHHNIVYHEFDFPSVCNRKLQLVGSKESVSGQDKTVRLFSQQNTSMGEDQEEGQWGFALAENGDDIRFCCHPLDLRRLPYTPSMKSLQYFQGLRPDLPTLVISECCLCYLEVDNAKDVMDWFAERISSLGILLYEPIGVDDSFGQMMVSNLAARNITMPTVRVFKSLADQKQRMSALLYKTANEGECHEAQTVERIWEQWVSPEEKERVDNLEGLDEVEEWQMLARHYAVVWGWRGSTGWENWKALKENQ